MTTDAQEQVTVQVTVNGQPHRRTVAARTLLSDFLRHDLGLTGTHVGCEHGVCGACTVLVDGAAVRSCLMLAAQVEQAEVRTVEALGTPDRLDPLQRAFMAEHGLQCGFCTPGILMSLVAAREDGTPLADAESEVLGGHICRCTGYVGIRRAIRAAWSGDGTEAPL